MRTWCPAVAIQVLLLAPPAAGAGGAPQPKRQQMAAVPPQLEVKQLTGGAVQWQRSGVLAKDALAGEFRWRTPPGVSSAFYEVSNSPFPDPKVYAEVPTLKTHRLTTRAAGVTSFFTVDFAPLLRQIFGTATPKAPVTFYVRLVLVDAQNRPLSPVSQTVRLDYAPPPGGTF